MHCDPWKSFWPHISTLSAPPAYSYSAPGTRPPCCSFSTSNAFSTQGLCTHCLPSRNTLSPWTPPSLPLDRSAYHHLKDTFLTSLLKTIPPSLTHSLYPLTPSFVVRALSTPCVSIRLFIYYLPHSTEHEPHGSRVCFSVLFCFYLNSS